MHKLVFVLSEPQWTLNTEALNYHFHYPALFGLIYCSNPKSDTFHLVWQSNTVAEAPLLKHLIKMRFMLSRWKTTVIVMLDCSYCRSAPLPWTTTSLDVPAYQSAGTYKPCMTCWHSHMALYHHAQYQWLAWRSLCPPLFPLPSADEVVPKSRGSRAAPLRSSSLDLFNPFVP